MMKKILVFSLLAMVARPSQAAFGLDDLVAKAVMKALIGAFKEIMGVETEADKAIKEINKKFDEQLKFAEETVQNTESVAQSSADIAGLTRNSQEVFHLAGEVNGNDFDKTTWAQLAAMFPKFKQLENQDDQAPKTIDATSLWAKVEKISSEKNAAITDMEEGKRKLEKLGTYFSAMHDAAKNAKVADLQIAADSAQVQLLTAHGITELLHRQNLNQLERERQMAQDFAARFSASRGFEGDRQSGRMLTTDYQGRRRY